MALSFAGLYSKKAWNMRYEFIEDDNVNKDYIAQSLTGLDSEEAWDMRRRLVNNDNVNKDYIARSLIGLDSKEAWNMRYELIFVGWGLRRIVRVVDRFDEKALGCYKKYSSCL